jgi:catalase
MADHWNHRTDDDYCSQPGALFRSMTPAQQRTLFDHTARAMRGTSEAIRATHIDNSAKADTADGAGVVEALKKLARG